jgi:hypothetical protein
VSEDYFTNDLKWYTGSGGIGGSMTPKIMGTECDADRVTNYPFSKQQGPSFLTIRQDSVIRLYYIYEEVNDT